MVSGAKNPVFVESGRRGARRRWGPIRTIKLTDLPPDQARAIRAFLEVAQSTEKAANDVETLAAASEGHSSDQPAA